jgi:ATP-dependent Clp protease ATP-binding subunit ClpC
MRPAAISADFRSSRGLSDVWRAKVPAEVIEAENRQAVLVSRIVHAIANHDFPGVRRYCYEEQKERENLRVLREKYGLPE